jgi:hypothetical protein
MVVATGPFTSAQAVYGNVKGALTDLSGKPISGAKVTITSVGKGTRFTTVTDSSGFYALNDVPPDEYSLKIEAGGYKTFQNSQVTVYADNSTGVNPKLVPGSKSDIVTGSAADVSVLKIDRTDVATILDRTQIADLPLHEQNTSNLEVLAPGAIPVTQVLSRAQNPQQGTYINVNGQLFSGTAYQLDGTDNRDPLEGIVVINPNQDAVEEMKITTSNYSAEFGEATAGVVTVQTKSGSNSLHGSLFDYSESAVGEASSPFLSPQLNNLTVKRNQFGASLGGPIIKERLFFFGDYRGERGASGATTLLNVPTQTMHNSCDSNAAPGTCNLSDYGGGTNLTANPATAALLTLLPEPNVGSQQYRTSGTEGLNSDTSDLRLDYNPAQRLKLFARYSYDIFRQDGAPAFGIAGGPGTNPDSFAGRARTYNQSLASGFSYSFSPNLLTDFRFGFFRYHLSLDALDFGTYPVQSVLPDLNDSLYSSNLPDVHVISTATTPNWEFGYSSALNNCNCPLREREQQLQFVNNWTRLAGRHTIRWGGDFRYIQNFRLDSANSRSGYLEFAGPSAFVSGQLDYFSRTYSDPANPVSFNAAERQRRAFFYGEDTWRINSRLTVNYGLRWEIYFPQYVNQDGAGGFLLIHNNALPGISAATINVAGTSGVNLQGNVQNTYKNFGPRIGFAYLAGSKTVIRAGFGRTFDVGYSGSLFGIAATQNPPVSSLLINRNGCFLGATGTGQPCTNFFALPTSISRPTASFTVQDLCNQTNLFDSNNCALTSATGAAPEFATALNALPATLRVPTVDAWNLTVQHQLSPNMYFEVAYIGNKGTHVLTDPSAGTGPISLAAASYYNLNQATVQGVVQPNVLTVGSNGTTPAGFSCKIIASNPNYCLAKEFERTALAPWNQPVNYFGNDASNHYESLQAKFNKRFAGGYSILANYIYSKVFDFDSNYYAIQPAIGYGPGTFDRRHNFTMANVWNLPIGRGRPFLHDIGRAADAALGGWSIQALTTWYSGLPFTPQYSNCPTDFNDQGVNIPPCRPNEVGHVSITGNRQDYYTIASGPLPYYQQTGTDPTASCGLDSSGNPQPGQASGPWQRPGCGQIGNAGRNSLRGPQFFQSDLSIMKDFAITERVSLRLRADAFNAFNKVNLGLPNPVVDGGNAGLISTTAPGAFQRQLQFSARIQF